MTLSVTDKIWKKTRGKRVHYHGPCLLMPWFFVRISRFLCKLMEMVLSKEVCHLLSSGNNDDSQRCLMMLPFSGMYNVFRLNDLSSLLREYAVSHLGCESMVGCELSCIWNVSVSKDKSRWERGLLGRWRNLKRWKNPSHYVEGSLLLDDKYEL